MLRRALTYLGATVATCACAAAPAAAATGPTLKAANGKKVQKVAGGLFTPTSFAFGGGHVFEGDGGPQGSTGPTGPGGVFVLSHGKASLIPGSPDYVPGLAWRGGTLYVSGALENATTHLPTTWKLWAWSGWNGKKFTKQKVIYTAPKGFPGFNGLAFGPDGRLYAGVDVGFSATSDHAPPSKATPYIYDILSFKANGKGLKVFATGIRQPWQLAFAPGSASPFVSDLGQDLDATNPPDFLLHVKQGDAFGFPQCNWTSKKLCKGFAKPFKMFAPHTDVGGVAIIGKTIYLSEFGFPGTGHPGEIATLPLKGGKVKPFVTGFVAPVIGLGTYHGWVYFGDLTGTVYRVHS